MCRKPGNTEDSHVTSPSSTRAAGSSPRDKRRRDIPQSTLISAQLGPLPSSLLWWERLPLVGWSVVPGGTHSSSACTRYARVFIQDRAFSSARNRSTSNMFIEKGFKASKDATYAVFKDGVPKRWLPNTTHSARGTF